MKPIRFAGVVLAVALATTAVRANGRFPRALHLIEDPCDTDHLVLAATFGLLSTFDRGKHWFHTCERAFSSEAVYSGDPLVALLRDGTMVVDVQSAVWSTAAHTCGFRDALAPAGQSIADFTVNRRDGEVLLAVSSALAVGRAPVHQLHESRDRGSSWQVVGTGPPLPIVLTLDVAPSDPDRVYVTGLTATSTGALLRSRDHGATWSEFAIPGTDTDAQPYIAAVHPTDPDQIFVRTDAWTNRDVIDTAADALLYSADGGATWRTVIEPRQAKLLGFAFSPDGTQVLAGYGNTYESVRDIDQEATGLLVAPLATLAFTRARTGSVTCLTWTAAGIFVCTPEDETGYQLGLAADPQSAPAPLLRLADLRGSLPACAGQCDWSTTCATFDACDAEAQADAGVLVPKTCGGGGASVDAGSPSERPEASVAGGQPASAGCSCHVLGGRSATASGVAGCGVLMLVVIGAARRVGAHSRQVLRAQTRGMPRVQRSRSAARGGVQGGIARGQSDGSDASAMSAKSRPGARS